MTAMATVCSQPSPRFPATKAASAWRWATSTTMACTICSSAPARITRRKSSSIRARPRTEKLPSRPSWRASCPSRPQRVAASAWPPRRSTGRAPTTSSSARVPAFRARSGFTARSCRHRRAPRRLCSRRSAPMPATARASALATGFVDYATGRQSIVTAPGPGTPAEVKVFAFPLLKPISNGSGHAGGHAGVHAVGPSQPANTASFKPFGDAYQGGVSLATGWLAGSLGGAERIVVSQLADAGTVKVFSSGSALDDGPALYLQSPNAAWPRAHLPRDRELQSVRRSIRHTRRHHEHDHRRRPAGQRRAGPQRERCEV